MSNLYDRPLRFKLDALRSYQLWFGVLYITAAALILFFTQLALTLKFILVICMLAALYWQWRQLKYLPRSLIQKEQRDWVLEDQRGVMTEVSLSADGYVSAWLIILYFSMSDNKKRTVVILPYMLDKDSFRKLNVYLRMTNISLLKDE